MAVWEDAELVSPHNQGACRLLVGDSNPPRRQEERQSEPVGCRGIKEGRRSGGQTRLAPPEAGEIRRGRWEDSPGRAGEEWRVIAWPTGAKESAELPSRFPHFKAPSRPCGSWGHRRLGRSGVAGGRDNPGGLGEDWREIALLTGTRGDCRAPRPIPRPPKPPPDHMSP